MSLDQAWEVFKEELDKPALPIVPVPPPTQIDELVEQLAGKTHSLYDLLVILGKEQIANSFITTTALTVLGNTTTTLTDQIQYNFEAIVTEERIVVGSDHAFSLQVITDGKTKWTDPDVVQARYAIPLNYASLGQNFNAQNTIQHIVQNTGGTDVYFSVTLIGVTMPIDWWTHFVKVYMDSITKGLGFKPSPLHGVRAIGER